MLRWGRSVPSGALLRVTARPSGRGRLAAGRVVNFRRYHRGRKAFLLGEKPILAARRAYRLSTESTILWEGVRVRTCPGFRTLAFVTADTMLAPAVGQAVLHLFCHVPADGGFDQEALRQAIKEAQADGYQVVPVALLGHKADLGLMVLGPDLWRLRELQSAVQRAGALPAASYVSLTEVSEYAAGVPEELRQARLFPQLPPEGKAAFCFYPMSKRRSAEYNWYGLDFESRKELMMGHGKVGRTFHGRILQVITGSTGLDEFEWGVTLFGVHPDDLKECVYEMRFDEASAHYAEFGPFYTGMVGDLDSVLAVLTGGGSPGARGVPARGGA
jgi:hydrogen peroxide-dependent heme synthase